LAPPPVTAQGPRSRSTRRTRGGDFYLATSGDLHLAINEDFPMATDRRGPHSADHQLDINLRTGQLTASITTNGEKLGRFAIFTLGKVQTINEHAP
jgi:hypothetical protein